MSLGKWGERLQGKGFDELYYLGEYPMFIQWCMETNSENWDLSTNEDFKNMSAVEKNKLRDTFRRQAAGNCGELANYFLRYSSVELSVDKKPVEHMRETFKLNQNGLFRITIGDTHTFIGIRSTITGQEIEILQAWQESYSVQDWLNKSQNVFSISEFLNNLEKLSSVVEFSRASDVLFSTAEKKDLLNKPASVTKFAFKEFSSAEMDAILLNELNPFRLDAPHNREAKVYTWHESPRTI